MNTIHRGVNRSTRPLNTHPTDLAVNADSTSAVNTSVNALNAVNTADDPTALWAAAQADLLPDDYPAYGSPAWRELPSADPRRFAAVLAAAELWRRHEVREAWLAGLDDDDWQQEITRDALNDVRRMRLSARPTRAELDALAGPLAAHRLTATPGWPPIAVPGQPGRYLTHPIERETA
ncbi:DUF2742 domain-containing protein [Streptomyces luteolus]|uniref:DUF2742 domain-containing protein n=1 Tax=Streptomyces luteolus TaxID=3043615 RepID=A0ABT6SQL3_9ACTN|nr:DUF2742 domain-containing protein [Streptomyces sp. B-S-A12]MDI3417898.1 DUF2742 domain-containing protein [Streptomyces sp. B-S-A12]